MPLKNIQAYSGIFSTLINPCIFTTIFWALAYLEPEVYLKPCETLTRHIQNPAIGHYSVIFWHIQNLVECLHTQKPGILGILEYSAPLDDCILTHMLMKTYKYSKLWHNLKPDAYSEPSQRFKIDFLHK